MPKFAAIRLLPLLLLLAACGRMSDQEADAIFEKNRAWFENVVQQVAKSRDINSIPQAGDFFDTII